MTKQFGLIAVMILALVVFPIEAHALLEVPFGFQIKEKVTCECSGFNHRYKPANFGIPAPLPGIPWQSGERVIGGSLATPPFGIPIPFFPRDEFDYKNIEEREWVMGITHGPPLVVPCVNLVFTWTGPKCKKEWGWLWRIVGSGGDPDYSTFIKGGGFLFFGN